MLEKKPRSLLRLEPVFADIKKMKHAHKATSAQLAPIRKRDDWGAVSGEAGFCISCFESMRLSLSQHSGCGPSGAPSARRSRRLAALLLGSSPSYDSFAVWHPSRLTLPSSRQAGAPAQPTARRLAASADKWLPIVFQEKILRHSALYFGNVSTFTSSRTRAFEFRKPQSPNLTFFVSYEKAHSPAPLRIRLKGIHFRK